MRRSYLASHDEFVAIGEGHRDGDGMWAEEADASFPGVVFTREVLETPEGFARFVARRREQAEKDASRPAGHVACSYFWLADDGDPDTYLGSLSIRHHLTPFLLEYGGHIGYSVRPSARRRGVAREALRLALPESHRLGIDPVLLTCDLDNAGSIAVIEANGGVLEDVRGDKRRYWVATGPGAAPTLAR